MCSACRSRRSAWCWATPTAATASAAPARARCSSAARPCASAPSARSSKARELAGEGTGSGRPPTSNTPTACSQVAGTDRSIGLFELAGAAARAAHLHRLHQHGGRPDLAERLPHLRGRDRSADRRRRGRGLCLGQRRRPRRQSDDRARPARRRRGAGHRPGAVRALGLRPRDRPAA